MLVVLLLVLALALVLFDWVESLEGLEGVELEFEDEVGFLAIVISGRGGVQSAEGYRRHSTRYLVC